MYILLTIFTGVLLAIMVSINGNLTAQYAVFPAAVIVHAVGVITALILCAVQEEKKKLTGHKPFWIYFGGAVGVATTVFQNQAFGKISMTRIVALGVAWSNSYVFARGWIWSAGNEAAPIPEREHSRSRTVFNRYTDHAWGGLIIAFGIALNYFLKYRATRKEQEEKEYWDRIKRAEKAHSEQVNKK